MRTSAKHKKRTPCSDTNPRWYNGTNTLLNVHNTTSTLPQPQLIPIVHRRIAGTLTYATRSLQRFISKLFGAVCGQSFFHFHWVSHFFSMFIVSTHWRRYKQLLGLAALQETSPSNIRWNPFSEVLERIDSLTFVFRLVSKSALVLQGLFCVGILGNRVAVERLL